MTGNSKSFSKQHILGTFFIDGMSVKGVGFVLALCTMVGIANPTEMKAQNTSRAKISTSTILDRLNQKIGISLPDEYNQKVLDFVLNDTIMRTRSATAYTEDFIINEMKEDRGISKQNQLLFIRSSIYGGISKNFLYDRLDDDNEIRSNEYEQTLKLINNSYEEYKKGFKIYMDTKSAEARQQSAEARQQSAEARQQSAEATLSGLNDLIKIYNLYKKNPNIVKDEEIRQAKEHSKRIIRNCKEFGIDYKAKLSPDMLKFYGVE